MNEENQPIVDNSNTYQETNNINTTSQSAPKSNSNKSLISLICGLVGLVIMGLPLGITAIVLSVLAKKEGSADGKATAGLILGIIDVLLIVVSIILYVIYIAASVAELTGY